MPLNVILGRFCNFLVVIEILILCLFQGNSFTHCWLVFWTQVPEGENGRHNLFAFSLPQPLSWKEFDPQWAGAGRKKKEKRKRYNSLKNFFFMWTIFIKPLLNLLKYCYCFVFFFWPWSMWDFSPQTRDWTHMPDTGRQSFNHWNTRKVPVIILLMNVLDGLQETKVGI